MAAVIVTGVLKVSLEASPRCHVPVGACGMRLGVQKQHMNAMVFVQQRAGQGIRMQLVPLPNLSATMSAARVLLLVHPRPAPTAASLLLLAMQLAS